jgi:hypothetical protein
MDNYENSLEARIKMGVDTNPLPESIDEIN